MRIPIVQMFPINNIMNRFLSQMLVENYKSSEASLILRKIISQPMLG